jgi:ribosomal protein S10
LKSTRRMRRSARAAVKALQEKGVPVDGPVEVPATGRRLATVRDPNGSLARA